MTEAKFHYALLVGSFLGIGLFLAQLQLSSGAGGGREYLSELLIDVNIPEDYLHIYPGEFLLAGTDIILIQEEKAIGIHDVLIEYAIKYHNDTIVTRAMETKGGILRISTIKELKIPFDAKPGIYTLEVTVSKENVNSKNSATFEVLEKIPESKNGEKIKDYVIVILVIFNFMFIIAIFLWMRKHKFR